MSIFDESVQLLETPWSAPVEDLYQAFKERLVAELGLGVKTVPYGPSEGDRYSSATSRTLKSQE